MRSAPFLLAGAESTVTLSSTAAAYVYLMVFCEERLGSLSETTHCPESLRVHHTSTAAYSVDGWMDVLWQK